MRRCRPLRSSGTRAVSVLGITHHGWRSRGLQNPARCSGVRRGEYLYNSLDVLISVSGKHRGNSSSETKIQRYKPDRLVVHGIIGLRADDRQRRMPTEKRVRWETGFIL